MALLELPPELFKKVICIYVSDVGVTDAWKCRSVCRTFAAEISDEILAKQPLDRFSSEAGLRLLAATVDVVLPNLAQRLSVGDPKYDQVLPRTMRTLFQMITDGEGSAGPVNKKRLLKWIISQRGADAIALELTRGASFAAVKSNGVYWFNYDRRTPSALTHMTELIAATAIGDLRLVKESLERANAWESHTFLGNPIVLAHYMGNQQVFDCLLDQVAVSSKSRPLLREDIHLALRGMINVHGKNDLTKALLHFCPKKLTTMSSQFFTISLAKAIQANDYEFVKLAFELKTKGKKQVGASHWASACSHGNVGILRLFLMNQSIKRNGSFWHVPMLTVAVKESMGKVGYVRTLLGAGWDANGWDPSEGKERHFLEVCPLLEAVSFGHANIVHVLVNHGATLAECAKSGPAYYGEAVHRARGKSNDPLRIARAGYQRPGFEQRYLFIWNVLIQQWYRENPMAVEIPTLN